jgi:hypothetical protein
MTNLLEKESQHRCTVNAERNSRALPNVVLLGQAEESSDLGSTLGTKSLGVDNVGETGDVTLALLDDRQGQHGEILTDNAATDGLALAFTGSSRSVAGVAVGEEELDTGREHL